MWTGRMEQDQDEAMITGEAAGHCTGDGRGAGHSQLRPQLPASASTGQAATSPDTGTAAMATLSAGGDLIIVCEVDLSMEVLICMIPSQTHISTTTYLYSEI